jgi:hypothetical protein
VRAAILTVGILMLLAGVALLAADEAAPALWLLVVGGAITVGTVLERVIYKPLLRGSPGPGWVKTAERFIDPDTGRPVDVFYNPASGERQYVSQDRKKD